MIICESGGIFYSFDGEFFGAVELIYEWLHFPSGKQGNQVIYIRGGFAALVRLVNHWNNGSPDWKYWVK